MNSILKSLCVISLASCLIVLIYPAAQENPAKKPGHRPKQLTFDPAMTDKCAAAAKTAASAHKWTALTTQRAARKASQANTCTTDQKQQKS